MKCPKCGGPAEEEDFRGATVLYCSTDGYVHPDPEEDEATRTTDPGPPPSAA